jgi:hypothetical protein
LLDALIPYLGEREGTDDEIAGFPKALLFELFAKFN